MHRRFKHRHAFWLAPFVGALAIAAFPAAAAAAGPLPTATPPCPALVANSPCFTSGSVALSPLSEFTSPPEGRILTVSAGTWSGTPAPTFTYQWYDCSTTVSCTSIPGASSRTYTITPQDVATKSLIAFVMSATNSVGNGYAVFQSTGPAVAAVPIDRVAPSVSGPAQDGQTLTANPGTWGGTAPISFTYTWRRCDSAGKNCGAVFTAPSSSPTYVLQDADLGHTMSVVVTATNPVGPTVQGSFAENAVVTPANTATPTIAGITQQGKTLTESHGSWLPSSPASYSYQWQSCDSSGAGCAPISGATSQSYTLTPSDVGHTISVQESAISGGVTSTPATSAVTGVVQAPPVVKPVVTPINTGQPTNNSGQPTNNSGSSGNVNAAQIRALLAKTLAPQGNGARIRALLKHGGYVFSFAAPSPGRLVISWYQLKHGKQILVATATFTFHKTGKASIKLTLTGKGRKLLKGAGTMKLIANGGFTPKGQRTTNATKSITLKP